MVRYSQVVSNTSLIPNFILYYEGELDRAKKDCIVSGNLEKQLRDLPGITEHRFNQLQEIEAVLQYLELELRKTRHAKFKKFLESYGRALSSSDAKAYADAEDDVIAAETLINEVALIRNKFLGVLKALESKNYQLGHISRIRTSGLEDVSI